MIEQVYQYAAPSALRPEGQGNHLSLATDLGVAPQGQGVALSARALAPATTAKGLRAVSDIVGSRFYVPPAMLARILREADPVVTVSEHAVRFEGFSACCSAYIRLDLDGSALDTETRRKGTTNVDFGPDLRGALASVRPGAELGLSVGPDAVEVVTGDRAITEKKVPLPTRWIKGFSEVQAAMAEMVPAFAVNRIAAQRFLRTLPRGKADHLTWVSASGTTVRTGARETKGSVPLRGSHRLRVLDLLAASADHLQVHINHRTGATAWTLACEDQRLCLVLNAEPWRGFSGDGGLLDQLTGDAGRGQAALRAQLAWQDIVVPDDMACATGLARADVDTGLAALAAIGQLGYDLHLGGFFHRVLPFGYDRIDELNPRLRAARALFEGHSVTLTNTGAKVASDNVVHTVTVADDGWRCTCPWHARNANQRGPCKHILATEIAQFQANGQTP